MKRVVIQATVEWQLVEVSMVPKSCQETGKIFDILVKGRDIDREAIIASLSRREGDRDYTELRLMLVNALTKEFAPRGIKRQGKRPKKEQNKEQEKPQQNDQSDRDPRALARRWLLKALALIGEADPEARSLTRKHLDRHYEPNRWARCEALAGLFMVQAPDLLELAATIKKSDLDPWPNMLAAAILADHGDGEAFDTLKQHINQGPEQVTGYRVAALRALRTVPIEELVDDVLAIACYVEKDEFKDNLSGKSGKVQQIVYDAVVALGHIPNTWPEASKAAEALMIVLKYCQRHPWLIDLRSKALRSLGNLKLPMATQWLIEELTNENPNIIFTAAVGLEKVLGTSIAVARVVEAASSNAESALIESYASALRWMKRELVIEKLEEIMVSGLAEQQETARILLIAIGGLSAFQKVQARRVAMDKYLEQLEAAEKQIRDLFQTSISEAQKGFKLATYMDLAVFVLGAILIAVSAILALINQGSLESWAGVGLTSGGAGVLGILYALLKDPRRQIPKEVRHLMYLKIVFLGYLRQLHQADQAYTRRLLEDQELTPTDLEEFSRLVGKAMQSAAAKITLADSAIEGTKAPQAELAPK